MPLQLQPLENSEFEIFWHIASAAFNDGGIMQIICPDGMTKEDIKCMAAQIKWDVEKHPGRHELYKIVDTDLPDDDELNKVVSVAHWEVFDEERSEEDFEREEEEQKQKAEELPTGKGMRVDVFKGYVSKLEEYRMKNLGGRPYVLLSMVATHPKHYRRGIAATHLKWGLDKADKLGLPAYLEGTPMGTPLYERWGYKKVNELPWDARDYGMEDSLLHWCMLRPAKEDRE